MKTELIIIVCLVLAAVNVYAEEPQRPALTTEAFQALSVEAKQAYLAGLADGLALSSMRPQEQIKKISTCMQGFPPDRRLELTANTERLPGEQKMDMNAPAAWWVVSRFSLICQLEFTAPAEPR